MNNIYDVKRIGARIRQERKLCGISQDELGAKLSVARQTIAKWERGDSMPQLYDLLEVCNLFKCELGYMLCEYDCKTRTATDIQAETGLSEVAISRITASISGRGIRMYTPSRDLERKALNLLLEFNGGEILALISDYLYNKEKPVELEDGRMLTAATISTSYLLEISGELQALKGKINGGAE